MAAEQFVGKWKLVESENFEEYMKEVGIGLVTRKAAANVKPHLVIKIVGTHWTILSTSTFKDYNLEFELDKEFEMTTADGRKMKSLFTLDNDGKLVQHERPIKDGDKESTLTRFVDGNRLINQLESGNVRSRRVYERVEA